jgi:hypothetical protein
MAKQIQVERSENSAMCAAEPPVSRVYVMDGKVVLLSNGNDMTPEQAVVLAEALDRAAFHARQRDVA